MIKLRGELGTKILSSLSLPHFLDELIRMGREILLQPGEDIETEEKTILELILSLLLMGALYKNESVISKFIPLSDVLIDDVKITTTRLNCVDRKENIDLSSEQRKDLYEVFDDENLRKSPEKEVLDPRNPVVLDQKSEKSEDTCILVKLVESPDFVDFLLAGLFTPKSQVIRKVFKNTFYLMVREEKERVSKSLVLLLLRNLPSGEDSARKDCMQFYELLCRLLDECGSYLKDVDFEKIKETMMQSIIKHASSEALGKGTVDNILAGYLNLFEKTSQLVLKSNFKPFVWTLLDYLFGEEKKVKFRTPVTRKIAYKIISNSTRYDEKFLAEIFQQKVEPIIGRIPRTDKTWNYNPNMSTRVLPVNFSHIIFKFLVSFRICGFAEFGMHLLYELHATTILPYRTIQKCVVKIAVGKTGGKYGVSGGVSAR